jgi:formate-dependent nitrite reductase membrane component NrfD
MPIAVWGRDRRVMKALGLLMSAFGVFVALYTGLVLSYERGIPFWHSAAVTLLALFIGVAAGSGLYGLLGRVETGKWIALGSGLAALTYLVHLHLSLIGLVAAAFSAQSAVSDPAAWRWRLLPRLLPCLGGRDPAWRPQAPWL